MSRPKCVACIECDGEVFCDCCDFNKRDGCSCYSSFTREERIAALLDALEELTGIKGLGANNPMESRLAIAALSDYIRNSKLKEAEHE